MSLLEHGRPTEDRFVVVADDAPLPADAPALIPLARLLRESQSLAGRNAELGVRVPSNARPEEMAPFLEQVSLVVVEFPKFRDGRGFTIARTLRERYGFAGELRAVGTILPDQHAMLLRCGFSSVAVPEGADLGPWVAALDRFHIAYQQGAEATPPLSLLRRRLSLGTAAG
jgi:uncharacterized protein (DUF934 family)